MTAEVIHPKISESSYFTETLEAIEFLICRYYGLKNIIGVKDLLLNAKDFQSYWQQGGRHARPGLPRAAVCLLE